MCLSVCRWVLLSLVFILKVSSAVAVDCESVFSSVGEVFSSFAKENNYRLRRENRIAFFFSSEEYDNKWPVSSAKEFLKDLQSRIGTPATLKLLERPYPFKIMSYTDFKEKATFYEEYIGKEGVNEILLQNKKGLLAFSSKHSIQEMRSFFDYMILYFGEEAAKPIIQEIISTGVLTYSTALKFKMFKEAIEELESIGKNKSAIKSIFLSHPMSLPRALLLANHATAYAIGAEVIGYDLLRHMPVQSPQLFGPFFSSILIPDEPGSYW